MPCRKSEKAEYTADWYSSGFLAELLSAEDRVKNNSNANLDSTMNVCIVTQSWKDGAAWYAHELARGFLEQGVAVALVAPAFTSHDELVVEDNQKDRFIQRKTTHEYNYRSNKYFAYCMKFVRIAQMIANIIVLRVKFNIYIFSVPGLVITPLLFLLLRLTGARVIFVVHDPFPHELDVAYRVNKIQKLKQKVKFITPSINVVLTKTGKKVLNEQFGIELSKIVVIPHPAFVLNVKNQLSGTEQLLSFGSIRSNKKILEVIMAVILARRKWPRLRLHIAGNPEGNEDYWAKCLNAIKDDPNGFVITARYIEQSEIPQIVADSDAFVLAYENFESQSGVAVMAGLNGRPVLATSMGGVLELQEEGLVVIPISGATGPNEISDAIETFQTKSISELKYLTSIGQSRLQNFLSAKRIAGLFLESAKDLSTVA
jgi:glycogen synthase